MCFLYSVLLTYKFTIQVKSHLAMLAPWSNDSHKLRLDLCPVSPNISGEFIPIQNDIEDWVDILGDMDANDMCILFR